MLINKSKLKVNKTLQIYKIKLNNYKPTNNYCNLQQKNYKKNCKTKIFKIVKRKILKKILTKIKTSQY